MLSVSSETEILQPERPWQLHAMSDGKELGAVASDEVLLAGSFGRVTQPLEFRLPLRLLYLCAQRQAVRYTATTAQLSCTTRLTS